MASNFSPNRNFRFPQTSPAFPTTPGSVPTTGGGGGGGGGGSSSLPAGQKPSLPSRVVSPFRRFFGFIHQEGSTPVSAHLGPLSLLTLSPISNILLSLLILALSILTSLTTLHSSSDQARQSLISSCAATEQAASVAVSLPHFAANNMNEITSQSIISTLNGLGTILDLTIQAIEGIASFIIDTYKSLYLCLAELAVRSTIGVAIDATASAQNFTSDLFNNIRNEVQSGINGADSIIQDAINEVNKLPGVNIQPPNISIPDLSALQNVNFPTDLSDSLTRLNDSLPTLDDLRNKLDGLVDVPFEDLRGLINQTLKNTTVDSRLFPVPERNSVTFCSDLNTSFIDDVERSLTNFGKISLLLIFLLFLLILLFLIWKDQRTYGLLLSHVENNRELWIEEIDRDEERARYEEREALLTTATASVNGASSPAAVGNEQLHHHPKGFSPRAHSLPPDLRPSRLGRILSPQTLLTFLATSTHPLLTRLLTPPVSSTIKTPASSSRFNPIRWFQTIFSTPLRKLRSSPQSRTHLAWFISYVSHPPAVAFLLTGLIGLVVSQVELCAVRMLKNSLIDGAAGNEVNDLEGLVRTKLTDAMTAQGNQWANGTNGVIVGIQNDINNNMFGWVNTTTTTMNSTLNEFYDGLINAVNTTFSGTPLDQPALQVINCLLGSKVQGISKALTFIHDNAHVNLPNVSPDFLNLSPNATDNLLSSVYNPSSKSPDSTNSDPASKLIDQIYSRYVDTIRDQRNIFLVFIGIYGLVLLMALIGVFWSWRLAKKYPYGTQTDIVKPSGGSSGWNEKTGLPKEWFDNGNSSGGGGGGGGKGHKKGASLRDFKLKPGHNRGASTVSYHHNSGPSPKSSFTSSEDPSEGGWFSNLMKKLKRSSPPSDSSETADARDEAPQMIQRNNSSARNGGGFGSAASALFSRTREFGHSTKPSNSSSTNELLNNEKEKPEIATIDRNTKATSFGDARTPIYYNPAATSQGLASPPPPMPNQPFIFAPPAINPNPFISNRGNTNNTGPSTAGQVRFQEPRIRQPPTVDLERGGDMGYQEQFGVGFGEGQGAMTPSRAGDARLAPIEPGAHYGREVEVSDGARGKVSFDMNPFASPPPHSGSANPFSTPFDDPPHR